MIFFVQSLRRLFFVFLVALFLPQLAFAAGASSSSKERDGIQAELAFIGRDAALVRWRFLRPLAAPIDNYEAFLDGTSVGSGLFMPFPVPGETSNLLVLIDRTGKDRGDEINRQIAAVLNMRDAKPFYTKIVFAPYDQSLSPILASDSDDLVGKLAAIEPIDAQPNLNDAVMAGITALGSIQGQRRGIYVFTDGYSSPPVNVESLSEAARSKGVSITFVLSGGRRAIERSKLNAISSRTGGQVVEPAGLVPFLVEPFKLLNNGAAIIFDMSKSSRYFWQSAPTFKFMMKYGEKRLELTAPFDAPIAGPQQTAEYLYSNHKAVVAGTGLLVLALTLGGAGFLAGRRRRTTVEPAKSVEIAQTSLPLPQTETSLIMRDDPEIQPVLAVLQNIGNGAAYSISSPLANIGRLTTNEIIISDPAVSRVHAVLEQQPFGIFSIENRSPNGTFVNHQKTEKVELADGDLITIGSTTLRYAKGR